MINATAIKHNTDLISLAEQAGAKFHRAGKGWSSACPLHGGDNPTAFNVFVGDNGEYLYRCWTHSECTRGKKAGDIFDFVMVKDNVPFKTALQTLGGDTLKNIPIAPRPKPTPKPLQIPDSTWQAQAWREVDAASDMLLHHPQGEAGRAFLTSRGISFAMWEAWRLGFMFYSPKDKPHIRIPVITIPWYDLDADGEIITAVKYRVISNASKLRFFSKGGLTPDEAGSKFDIPFGLWDALPGFHHSLLFVEGELNCISVSQCRPAGVSVLSFGSEGGGDARALQSIAARYKDVYVWADDVWDNPQKAKRAKELQSLVKGRGIALRSVKQDEVKRDANQLLQDGNLDIYLSAVLNVACTEYPAEYYLNKINEVKK